MIFLTVEEFKTSFPTHDLDTIDTMQAQFHAAELDWLKERLGTSLLSALNQKHDDGEIGETGCWYELLRMSQDIVAYATEASMANINAVNINNSGMNVVTNDNFGSMTKDQLAVFKADCEKEVHKAVNRLLVTLEEWSKNLPDVSEEADPTDDDLAKVTIITLWKESKYYYDVAGLLINTATTLQYYVDFYENRDRFITFIPDLRNIQETLIEDELGTDLLAAFVDYAVNGEVPSDIDPDVRTTSERIYGKALHMLRRAMAAELQHRNKFFKSVAEQGHSEYVGTIQRVCKYLSCRQDYLGKCVETSPFYVSPDDECCQPREPKFVNNRRGNAMFVMPSLK